MITDLRDSFNPDTLHSVYASLYAPVFTDENENETEEQYAQRLQDPQGEPETHFLVYWAEQEPVGFLIAEHYRECNCGLLTYMSVSDKARGKGVAAQLVAHAQRVLSGCRVILAECHKPESVDADKEPIDPVLRLRILSSLGASLVPIDYVQPALRPGQQPSSALHLVSFPLQGREHQGSVDTAALLDFLTCFYRVLGAEQDDPALSAMCQQLCEMPAKVPLSSLL